MKKLRTQLDDIERCAEEATQSGAMSGGVAAPDGMKDHTSDASAGAAEQGGVASAMAEKQRIIIEELRKRFDFQFGDLERLR